MTGFFFSSFGHSILSFLLFFPAYWGLFPLCGNGVSLGIFVGSVDWGAGRIGAFGGNIE